MLIIDDASPDDSAAVAARLAAADQRIEVRVHELNRGHIATYNEGLLEWAEGDYCVLISADDLLTPGSLARATAVLEAHPASASCTPTRSIGTTASPGRRRGYRRTARRSGAAWTGCASCAAMGSRSYPARRWSSVRQCITPSAGTSPRFRTPPTSSCGCGWRHTRTSPTSRAPTRPTTASMARR